MVVQTGRSELPENDSLASFLEIFFFLFFLLILMFVS